MKIIVWARPKREFGQMCFKDESLSDEDYIKRYLNLSPDKTPENFLEIAKKDIPREITVKKGNIIKWYRVKSNGNIVIIKTFVQG